MTDTDQIARRGTSAEEKSFGQFGQTRRPYALASFALLPVGAALAGLVAFGQVPFFAAGVALAGAAVISGGLSWYGNRRRAALEKHLADLAANPAGAPSWRPSPGWVQFIDTVDLAESLEALRRRLLAEERQALQVSRAFDSIFEHFPDPLILVDEQGRVVRANAPSKALLPASPVGRALNTLLRAPELAEAVEQSFRQGTVTDAEYRLAGSVPRSFSARVQVMQVPGMGRSQALVAMREVTAIKRAEEMRADFVAHVSHELRTPLTTLVGFIETIQGPARGNVEETDRFLDIMHEQAERMRRIVADLLSLSRIELLEHAPPTGQADLSRILTHIGEALALTAGKKGMSIRLEIADDLPAIPGDPDQLTQLFQNLMDNAIKYGRSGTPVTVTAKPTASGMIEIRVADCGEGISPQHLPRLTERFYRVDSARSRRLGGTGLGLAIVKHIVNRHRGFLDISSQQGKGSTFTVQLPAGDADGS